ncbi:MAG: DUF222 domain-containing protein [Propionibacteriales bacterium]|nr:DUF222 domain-containing protein [Propionibacteriales bacterium]
MTSGTTTLDAAGVLAAARDFRREANAAEAGVLAKAVEWARLHVVSDLDDASTVLVEGGRDTGIPIAGEGAPLVSDFAVAEFASALGLSAASGRTLVGLALELAHRLPKLWDRVQDGSLAPWRARLIAEETLQLSPDAAGYVDAQLAPFAHKTGPAQTQRLVETAIATFMPGYAAERRERAADQRHCDVNTDQISFAGTSRIDGEVDFADALDFDDAIAALAQQLADAGSTETLDHRRAAAVGMLARGELALDVVSTGSTTAGSEPERTETGRVTRRKHRRDVVLYVHLSEDALRTHDPAGVAQVENAGGQLVTTGQVAQWCGRPDTDRIIVKPVRDLTAGHHPDNHRHGDGTESYQVPDAMAEDIDLRDKTCVFPWCHRPARRCDKDHTVPHDQGGPTCACNLAPLCRLHHRMKTHGGWTYTILKPGTYLWRSPYGYTWLRDQTGTTDLTPPPVDPPPRRTS